VSLRKFKVGDRFHILKFEFDNNLTGLVLFSVG